jgi:serine protease Do
MKRKIIIPSIMTASAIAIGFAVTDSRIEGDLTPKLHVDISPLDRSGPFGGYSPIVEEIAPSVVSIFTTREAKSAQARIPDQYSQAPGLRDFFEKRFESDPRRGNQGAPRSRPKQQGLGSGVILTSDGLVLTNNHVVEQADEIKVRLGSGEEYDAKIVATDPSSDLAVIKVDATGLPGATIGDSEAMKQGDLVLAIGSPFGLNQTVTSGIVSAIGRDNLNITGYENFIQTDASINPGNSGGALVDNKGRVIGINTAILSRSGGNVGIGFAIPINMAVRIAEELIEHGEIKRGYLGVALADLDEGLAAALSVKARGVLVNEVMPDTPAEKAGFEAGDVITEIDAREVGDIADVRRMVGREKPGSELSFVVQRDGKPLTLTVTTARMPENLLTGGPPTTAPARTQEGSLKGVRLGKLDDAMRQRLELDESTEGVVVLEVHPECKAAQAGLRPGQVITEVNRESVNSPKEAYAHADDRQDKATLLRVLEGGTKRFLAIG